jgi:riboflavin synthase
MFTGLIQDIGKIQSIERKGGGFSLMISSQLDLGAIKIGDSIAVDGVCLTVVRLANRAFTAEVSPETLQRTTLRQAKDGQKVNLEMPLRMADPLGGHLVAGHVDGTGEIIEVTPRGNALWYRFRVPPEIAHYLIEKGSVAVDGISLTVAGVQDQEFSVCVVPHTAERTTLGKKKAGDPVNLEVDQIAKYVEKFLRQRNEPVREASRIDAAFLAEHGFTK